jgi:flagellar motility protein MotE (MotC chaperone)
MTSPKHLPAPPRGWTRPPLLPLAAAGLVGLLPWFGADLAREWSAVLPTGPSDPVMVAAAPAYLPQVPLAPMLLAGGALAQPVLLATLSGAERPAPVGEERPVDSRLLAEVARRKAELDRREHDLQLRETHLAATEQLARKQLAELGQMRQAVEGLVVHESKASEDDLTLLVGLYSNMKPPQAAAVLGKLEAPKAAIILQRLETRMAGPILAAMENASAVAITEELEQRRAAFRP